METIFNTNNRFYSSRSPLVTQAEWKRNEMIAAVIGTIGIFAVFSLMAFIVKERKCTKYYLLICTLCASCVASISLISLAFNPSEFCFDNSAGYTQADGFSVCVVQGAINMYSSASIAYSVLLQSIDIFTKVSFNCDLSSHWRWHILFIFSFPCLSIIYVASMGSFGFAGTVPFCLTSHAESQANVDLVGFYAPMVLAIFIASCCMVSVICTIIYRSLYLHHHNVSVMGIREWRMLYTHEQSQAMSRYCVNSVVLIRSPLLFVFSFLFIMTTIAVNIIMNGTDKAATDASTNEWLECIFAVFDGTVGSNQRWRSICGEHPKIRNNTYVLIVAISMQSVLLALAFFPFTRLRGCLSAYSEGCLVSMIAFFPRFSQWASDPVLPVHDEQMAREAKLEASPPYPMLTMAGPVPAVFGRAYDSVRAFSSIESGIESRFESIVEIHGNEKQDEDVEIFKCTQIDIK